jgi:hypothetical protein
MPIAPLLQQSTGTSGGTAWEVELDICMDSRLGLAFIISSEDDHLSLPVLPRPAGYSGLLLFFLPDIEPIYCF